MRQSVDENRDLLETKTWQLDDVPGCLQKMYLNHVPSVFGVLDTFETSQSTIFARGRAGSDLLYHSVRLTHSLGAH